MIVWHSVRSGWLQVFSSRRHTLFDQQTSHGASLSVSQFYPVIHGQQQQRQHQNQPKCGRVGTVVGTVCIIREKSCELKNTHTQTNRQEQYLLIHFPSTPSIDRWLCYAMLPFLFREFEFELSFFCPLTVVVVPHHCGCTTSSSQCCCCCCCCCC